MNADERWDAVLADENQLWTITVSQYSIENSKLGEKLKILRYQSQREIHLRRKSV